VWCEQVILHLVHVDTLVLEPLLYFSSSAASRTTTSCSSPSAVLAQGKIPLSCLWFPFASRSRPVCCLARLGKLQARAGSFLTERAPSSAAAQILIAAQMLGCTWRRMCPASHWQDKSSFSLQLLTCAGRRTHRRARPRPGCPAMPRPVPPAQRESKFGNAGAGQGRAGRRRSGHTQGRAGGGCRATACDGSLVRAARGLPRAPHGLLRRD
jgi:hypothetical protein